MKKTENKDLIIKYLMAIFICILPILLTYFIFKGIDFFKEKNYEESYLVKTKTINKEINYEEITNLKEVSEEYFIFIGYTNDKNVYKLEKDLRKIILKYNLSSLFYYLDITNLIKEDDYITKINKLFKIDNKIKIIPTILYFRDGQLAIDGVVVRDDNNMINAGDFEKLLEIYEFKSEG